MVDFTVVERTEEEYYNELEEFYQRFKEYWTGTDLRKSRIYQILGTSHSNRCLHKYVNRRLKEDGLPATRSRRKDHSQPLWKPKMHRYIRDNGDGTWRVQRRRKGMRGYYGSFRSLTDAVMVRDWLELNDWDIPGVTDI